MSLALHGARAAAAPPVMRTPRGVDIEITARCNLRCRYCYFFDNDAVTYRDLATGEWLSFFDELGRAAVMGVTLCGGEPFLREDLPGLIAGIVANGMRFSILSNGSAVTEESAAAIASSRRCDYVQVSVDGPRAEIHDAMRGRGSFDAALGGIATLRRHGVLVTSRVTIHRANAGEIEATVRFLLDEVGLPFIGTNAAGALGSCRHRSGEILLSPAERSRAMATLLDLERRYPGRLTAAAGPLAEGRMWMEMETARRDGDPPPPEGGRLTGCGCPSHRIAVRADGSYLPCLLLPGLVLGRVNEDRLTDIWRASPLMEKMRRRGGTALSAFGECRGCDHLPWCTGNCPAIAFSLTGETDRPSPEGCLRRHLEAGGTLPAGEGDGP